MKVAIFTDSFLPHVSGVCSAVLNQANEMARRGHEIVIYRPKAFGKNNKKHIECSGELNAKIKDVPISIKPPGQPDLHIAFPTLLSSYVSQRKFRADLIHVHTEWGCGWEGVMLARMLGIPIVGTFHTFFAEPEYLKQFKLPNLKMTKEMMWRYSVFFYNHCDALIAPSRSVADQLIEKGILVEPTRVSNGIPLPSPAAQVPMEELCEQWGLSGFGFVYVGRLSEEKSIPVLIEAFARTHARDASCSLLIIGDGKQREELEALVQSLGLSHAIRFAGKIPHAELISKNIPRVAKVFVTASKTENQPVSILEAMAFGLPVLGVDARGIPELVSHGATGLLAEPDNPAALSDNMLRMMKEPVLYASCQKGALAFAEENRIESVGRQLEEIYKDTIHTSGNTKRPRRRLLRRGQTKL